MSLSEGVIDILKKRKFAYKLKNILGIEYAPSLAL
jgi:hypothetical protein